MMTDAQVFAALDDRWTLALTAWAEARQVPRGHPRDHSPVEELIAVMVVARNRRQRPARWQAHAATYKAVCLAPKQFSCWNEGSGSNHDALMALARRLVADPTQTLRLEPVLAECLFLADGVIRGVVIDRTGSSNSYWAPAGMNPPGRVPIWAVDVPQTRIGDQIFIRLA